jgi:pantetheine-phosphate adenylyltransferase
VNGNPNAVKLAIYPGSFDPITLGHLDVIERACALFDRITVAVAASESKHPLFSVSERCEMIADSLPAGLPVFVKPFDGLLVDFARAEGSVVVIRGLRAVSDFEFEFQMALMNRRLDPKFESVFLTPREDCTFISSRIVKEVAKLGGDVREFVPAAAAEHLKRKFQTS